MIYAVIKTIGDSSFYGSSYSANEEVYICSSEAEAEEYIEGQRKILEQRDALKDQYTQEYNDAVMQLQTLHMSEFDFVSKYGGEPKKNSEKDQMRLNQLKEDAKNQSKKFYAEVSKLRNAMTAKYPNYEEVMASKYSKDYDFEVMAVSGISPTVKQNL